MSRTPDEPDLDPVEREGADPDPDTNLILDYLANKLDSVEVGRLEERARRDKAFRYKLADLVLLKGLVMLALEKHPPAGDRGCRRTQRLFTAYRKGRTSARKTAELSRHLDECLECELAFERFQEAPDAREDARPGFAGWVRQIVHPSRSLAIAALVAVVLAAGAVGMVGFLSSASASPAPGVPGSAAGGTMAEAGLIASPDEVRAELADLCARDPRLPAQPLADLVDGLLANPSPAERGDAYAALDKDYGAGIHPLLWKLAGLEPNPSARWAAYRAVHLEAGNDPDRLYAATRREIDARSSHAHYLLPYLAGVKRDDVQGYLRGLFASPIERDREWWSRAFYAVYAPMKGDPVIDQRMVSCLSDSNEVVRSHAALAAATADNRAALPIALGLLDSTDSSARFNAALAIARLGSSEEVDQLFTRPWAREATLVAQIGSILKRRGMSIPQNF
jgi:hypothetical protein